MLSLKGTYEIQKNTQIALSVFSPANCREKNGLVSLCFVYHMVNSFAMSSSINI